MKKNIFFISILFILFLGLTFINQRNSKIVSYLKISFNPTMEFGLNQEDQIVEVVPLNEDAEILIEGQNLIGLNIEDALELLIDDAVATGFIKELEEDNIIEVMTFNDKEEKRLELEGKILERIEGRLSEKKVAAVLAAVKLSDSLKEEAEQFNISIGKMMLIEQALYLNDALIKENLVSMSIKDIQKEIRSVLREEIGQMNKEERLAKKEELKEKHNEEIEAFKEQIKSRIANFNSLSEEEKEAKIEERVLEFKEDIRNKAEELQEKVEEIKSNNPSINVPGRIRDIIRNGRN